MTRAEFLSKLASGLEARDVADARDILGEYEEHFAFKLADGYAEEEIAAKLGDPLELAAQYEAAPEDASGYPRFMAAVGLGFTGFFAGIVFTLLWLWVIVMGAAALAFVGLAGCLFFGVNPYALIPSMPYWCGAMYGLTLIALACLAVVGCCWFTLYLRQLMRAYARFHHNARAAAAGKPALPSVSLTPRLSPKAKRLLRRYALCALTVFAGCFVLSVLVSMLSAGGFAFWHIWNWFSYAA